MSEYFNTIDGVYFEVLVTKIKNHKPKKFLKTFLYKEQISVYDKRGAPGLFAHIVFRT